MALYNYKAVTDHGRMVQGRLDAINLLDLEMRLKRMELDFVNATPIANNSVFNRTTITRPELITFCFHGTARPCRRADYRKPGRSA